MSETKGDDKAPKGDDKTPKRDENEHCETCKLIFVAKDKFIACDICGTWFLQTWPGLNPATYKSLNSCKDNSPGWYCKICREVSQPLHVKMLELQLGQDKLRERIRNLEESKVSKDEIEECKMPCKPSKPRNYQEMLFFCKYLLLYICSSVLMWFLFWNSLSLYTTSSGQSVNKESSILNLRSWLMMRVLAVREIPTQLLYRPY